jgi:hypothetical protein
MQIGKNKSETLEFHFQLKTISNPFRIKRRGFFYYDNNRTRTRKKGARY